MKTLAVEMNMIEIITELSKLRMGPNCSGLDECTKILQQILPFQVYEFKGGAEVNGWVCPMKWEAPEAKIKNSKGEVIYDGNSHPLGVIGYSQPFKGSIKGSELKKHLFFSAGYDDALIYHCDLFYKPFRKEWGFSVTKKFFNSIDESETYQIDLQTTFEEGSMKVSEYVLKGESEDSIVLNAHNCHAFCCNDDLAGVAVAIEVMRRLAALPSRRFTYRLIIAPEHFGSIFYLNSLSDSQVKRLKWGIFLEMLGTTGPLGLQRSFTGISLIDRAFLNVLKYSKAEWKTDYFRKIVGNDETCWEAAGYEVPFVSLSRFPYPEYHTSHDNPSLMNKSKLEEAVQIVMDAFFVLENDSVMNRKFKGLVALSHPRYNLYKPFWDPSEPDRRTIDDSSRNWNHLMDCLPRYFNNDTRLLEIAERHGFAFKTIFEYVKEFETKGLVSLSPAPASNPVVRSIPPQ